MVLKVPAIEVIRGTALTKGVATPGIVREVAFEGNGVLYSSSRIAGGVKSAWHHHGARELYTFVVAGRLRLEYNDGKDSVEANAGDFIHIPVGLVHRDVNPDQKEAVVVAMLLGEGPSVVNV